MRAYQAAAISLPSQSMPAQALGKLLLYPAIGFITGLQRTGLMSSVSQLRSELNDPAVFGATAKRLYLYSTADQMVRWEDVESHLAEAKAQLGCCPEGVAFPDSPHCAIVRDHADRYWYTIGRFRAGREVSTPAAMTSGQLGDGLNDRLRSRI